MKFTVLGGRGFVGSHLAAHLTSKGHDVDVPDRDFKGVCSADLGHVVYAIGLTGDFRERPFDTVEAHVSLLSKLLRVCRFDSWLYLSSTRVYSGLQRGQIGREDSEITVAPGSDSLYNLSKLLGESLCLAGSNPTIRVARLSNVYGAGMSEDTFLGSVMGDLCDSGGVTINESAESGKDYVDVGDVCALLEAISLGGKARLYNVACGRNVTHKELFEKIHSLTGHGVRFLPAAPTRLFPMVDISRLRKEFGIQPSYLLDTLDGLLTSCGVRANPGDDL